MYKLLSYLILSLMTIQFTFGMEPQIYLPKDKSKADYTFNAKNLIKLIYTKFNGNKKDIEKYISLKFSYNPNHAIKLAKEYYYIYGKVFSLNSFSENRLLAKLRQGEFLNIGFHYGFSIQDLIDNNKIYCNYTSHLKALDLSNLKIESLIGLDNLELKEQVEYLFLDHNQLTFIPEYSFQRLPNLINLYLNNNNIKNIDLNAFPDATKIPYINLINNKFDTEIIENIKNYFYGKAMLFI